MKRRLKIDTFKEKKTKEEAFENSMLLLKPFSQISSRFERAQAIKTPKSF